ncbi:MAG TPA: TetR/AcrR family transcriptional regulator [Rhodocyclaceae bacterium]|nr:TetR/AcrR family transcriptional regulator [Rhodocyclaceae bacterium]
MKVNKEQSIANREALLEAAGKLFRLHGIDGVGVAQLCDAAGLTHGALYSHFGSKEALAAEAFLHGHHASHGRISKAAGTAPDLNSIVDFYVSARHRDNMAECCPILSSGSEAARQDEAFKKNYAQAFHELSKTIQSALEAPDTKTAESMSLVLAASMIGIVSVARSLKDVEPKVSDTLLSQSRRLLKQIAST